MKRLILIIAFVGGCNEENLPGPPIAGYPDDDSSTTREPPAPSDCQAYINCRETCEDNDDHCRIECGEVADVDLLVCIDERCGQLEDACALNPGGASCKAWPKCDDDVEAGSSSTDATGESSSGESTGTGEDSSSSSSESSSGNDSGDDTSSGSDSGSDGTGSSGATSEGSST